LLLRGRYRGYESVLIREGIEGGGEDPDQWGVVDGRMRRN